ncbi:MAG: hypothetical protein A2020_16395 [Lentisphaerae bacterium GWF2_45_14]|nr:MAG: hypothetical protein A2020_16395 [Lentisphaerae bacterium GWF2_45_14]
MNVSMSANSSELARLNRNIDEMVRVTGRDTKTVVRNAGRDLIFAAVRNTPLAPKAESMKFQGGFVVVMYHRVTGKKVTFIGSREQASKYGIHGIKRLVVNRGFCKAAWLANLPALGITPNKSYPGARNRAAEFSRVFQYGKGSDYGLSLSNIVPFIEDMDKGRNKGGVPLNILPKSMSEVSSKWDGYLKKLAEKAEAKLGK